MVVLDGDEILLVEDGGREMCGVLQACLLVWLEERVFLAEWRQFL